MRFIALRAATRSFTSILRAALTVAYARTYAHTVGRTLGIAGTAPGGPLDLLSPLMMPSLISGTPPAPLAERAMRDSHCDFYDGCLMQQLYLQRSSRQQLSHAAVVSCSSCLPLIRIVCYRRRRLSAATSAMSRTTPSTTCSRSALPLGFDSDL